MLVDTDVLYRARKGNSAAMIEVMSAQYPSCYRMAHALSGRDDVGNAIVIQVMKQSMRAVQTWHDDAAPQRWFRHHTLLMTRRAARGKPNATNDTLALGASDAAYLAFVHALRALGHQQVEAFLLTHCEGLDLRGVAVGMDCSTTAAQVHLRESEQRLRLLASAQFEPLLAIMRERYQGLTPSKDLALGRVRPGVRRFLFLRRLARSLRFTLILILLALIIVLIWYSWPQISSLRSTTAPATGE